MRIGIVALSSFSGAAISDLINQTRLLGQQDKKNEYFLFLSKKQYQLADNVPSCFIKVFIAGLPAQVLLRTIISQIILPFYIKKNKIDLLYCLGNIGVFFTSVKTLLLIQNANPFSRFTNWSLYQKLRNCLLALITAISARKAVQVLYVSENSKALFNQAIGIRENKTRVIYHAWEPQDHFPSQGVNLPADKNILNVTSVLPYKKINILMKAFDQLVNNIGYPGELLIVGQISDEKYYHELMILKARLKNGYKIRFLGFFEHKHLFWFYTKAEIMVFSSIEETFGIPLLEAMGMGVPIIAAEAALAGTQKQYFNPSREICKNAAVYYNPFSENDLCNKMIALLKDSAICKHLRDNGLQRVKAFAGKIVINQLINLFDELSKNDA